MKSVDGFVLTFLCNALWQIPLLFAVATLGARLLRRGPARYRHALWLAALVASVALPALSLLPREPAPRAAVSGPAAFHPEEGYAPAVWQAWMPVSAPDPAQIPGALARGAVLLYGLSLTVHAVRLTRAWRWTERLARGARAVADSELPERAVSIAARCRAAFGLRPVPLFCSGAVDGPVTLGAREPAILLPPAFLESAPADDLTAALGHEMAHIHRRDFLVNLLCELSLLPVAFHPVTRWLRRRLVETREMACDEATVERLLAPRVYARSLLSMASTLAGSSRPAYTLGAVDADFLEVRMRRLLDSGPRLGTRRARTTLGLAALLLATGGLLAVLLSFDAEAARTPAGDLAPFLGIWTGSSSPAAGVVLPAHQLVIQEAGGQPHVSLTLFRHRRQPDGTFKTEPVHTQATQPRVTGRVLRFRVQAEMRYKPDGPQETVEFDQVFELLGESQGRLRQVWSSLEGRNDVPPPPPPSLLNRRS